MAIYCDLFAPLGDSIGTGPIADVIYARFHDSLDLDGQFYFEMPATHPMAQYVRPPNKVRFYSRDARGEVEIGRGEISSAEPILRQDLPPVLVVRGRGQLAELAYAPIPHGTAYDDEDNVPIQIIEQYAAALDEETGSTVLPDAWILTGKLTTNKTITKEIVGASVLETLISIAEETGEHFRRGTNDREIVWIGTVLEFEDSGLTATDQYYSENADLCRIISLRVIYDGFELFNRIYPYGATQSDDTPLTLGDATTWPDGATVSGDPETRSVDGISWTLDKANNLLTNNDSIAAHGPRGKILTLNQVRVEDGTSAADASNALLQAALEWAKTRGSVARRYEMTVGDLRKTILPGQTIRTLVRWVRDGLTPIDIDEVLYVLDVVTEGGGTDEVTVNLLASTADRRHETEADMILSAVVR